MISTGTVFDIGYQSYTGPREGRKRGGAAAAPQGTGALDKQSVDEFLKTLEPKSLDPKIQ